METMARGEEKLPKKFGLDDDAFQLVKRIGVGGQASVYMCKRMNTGNKYAAKVIKTSSLGGKEHQVVNLQREIRVMRELHHPRIVNLHEFFWVNSTCIIVMDLAVGGNLEEKVIEDLEKEQHPFRGLGGGEIACKHVAVQLIDGISYMHDHRVLHRDLKLANILVTASEPSRGGYEYHDIKIADFGLSKFQDRAVRHRMTAVGTPEYVAPEVLQDDAKYDERVDFWSYGVILYAILCGCMPFAITAPVHPDRHRKEVSRIQDCEPWQRLSAEAKDFVRGLLAVDPDDRLIRCTEHAWFGSVLWHCSPRTSAPTKDLAVNGLVGKIIGRTSAGVNCIEIHLRDGSKAFHGAAGGRNRLTHVLEPGELLSAVMQDFSHPQKLGSALVFYTAQGRILRFEGRMARTRNRFLAPLGSQVAGLQFDGPRLVGVHLKEADDGSEGVIEHISGSVGSAVDSCKLQLRSGVSHHYGTPTGTTVVEPWRLQSEEFVTIVEQFFRDRNLGASLAFYTSAGRVFKMVGMTATRSPRFAAPKGHQICGISFTEDGMLAEVTCAAHSERQTLQSFNIEI